MDRDEHVEAELGLLEVSAVQLRSVLWSALAVQRA